MGRKWIKYVILFNYTNIKNIRIWKLYSNYLKGKGEKRKFKYLFIPIHKYCRHLRVILIAAKQLAHLNNILAVMTCFCFGNTTYISVVTPNLPAVARLQKLLDALIGAGRCFDWQADLLPSPLLFLSTKLRKLDLHSQC